MTEKDWRLKPMDILKKLEGLDLEVAKETVGWFGYLVRPVEIDGITQVVTSDYNTKRVNVVISGDIITKVKNLG